MVLKLVPVTVIGIEDILARVAAFCKFFTYRGSNNLETYDTIPDTILACCLVANYLGKACKKFVIAFINPLLKVLNFY